MRICKVGFCILFVVILFSLSACSPSKRETVLTYAISSQFEIDEDTALKINEHLKELKKDYSVRFLVLDATDYPTALRKCAKEENADLLCTGSDPAMLSDMVRSGYLMELDSFLQSEAGKPLYTSVPADSWYSTTVNQNIYYANGNPYTTITPPSYHVNTNMMRKYGLTEKDLSKPIYKLEGILKKVYEGEKENTDFSAAVIHPAFTCQSINQLMVTNIIQLNEQTGSAQLLIDDPEYVKWLRTMYDYYIKGYLRLEGEEVDADKFMINLSFNSNPPEESISMGRYGEDKDHMAQVIVEGYDYYSSPAIRGTAIFSSTEYPEQALDFLTTIFTDQKITNLMIYGANYESLLGNDGKFTVNDYPLNRLAYGNYFVASPQPYEYADMRDKYMDFHAQVKKSSFTGFLWNIDSLEAQIDATNEIVNQRWTELFTNETNVDIDAFLTDVHKELETAGAQEIVDELNRQLKAFQEGE